MKHKALAPFSLNFKIPLTRRFTLYLFMSINSIVLSARSSFAMAPPWLIQGIVEGRQVHIIDLDQYPTPPPTPPVSPPRTPPRSVERKQ